MLGISYNGLQRSERQVEVQNLIEHYKTNFRTDPLYRKIDEIGCLDELFSDATYFTKVNLTDTYSSKHTAEILSLTGREQTLVNYINREDLSDYLLVYRQGRFYRYDWITIFKFKMILLLNEKGYTPMEIATFAGSRVEITQNKGPIKEHTSEENSYQSDKVSQLLNVEKMIEEYTDSKMYSLHNLIRYKEIMHQEKFLSAAIEQCENNIKTLERDIHDRQLYSKLFQMTASARTNQSPGFFAKLFSRNTISDNEQNTEEFTETLTALDNRANELQEEIENQLTMKEQRQVDLTKVQEQLTTLRLEIEKESAAIPKQQFERMITHDT